MNGYLAVGSAQNGQRSLVLAFALVHLAIGWETKKKKVLLDFPINYDRYFIVSIRYTNCDWHLWAINIAKIASHETKIIWGALGVSWAPIWMRRVDSRTHTHTRVHGKSRFRWRFDYTQHSFTLPPRAHATVLCIYLNESNSIIAYFDGFYPSASV